MKVVLTTAESPVLTFLPLGDKGRKTVKITVPGGSYWATYSSLPDGVQTSRDYSATLVVVEASPRGGSQGTGVRFGSIERIDGLSEAHTATGQSLEDLLG